MQPETLAQLEEYGPFRETFRGSGSIRFAQAGEVAAEFALAQHHSGRLFFAADLTVPERDVLPADGSGNTSDYMDRIETFSGRLADGRAVKLGGDIHYIKWASFILWEPDQSTMMIGRANQCEIGERVLTEPATITFDLVNFIFQGTEMVTVTEEGWTRSEQSVVEVNLGGRVVTLRQIPGYKRARNLLFSQGNIHVTCTASAQIESLDEIDEVTATIKVLYGLLSIARGTLVNWISYAISNPDQPAFYAFYQHSMTREYAGLALIYPGYAGETSAFIETGFVRYQALMATGYPMHRIASQYVEARNAFYVETKALQAAVLVEQIASIHASQAGQSSSTAKNNPARRLSFKQKLEELVNDLALQAADETIRVFVANRNSLAHTGRFPKGSPIDQYHKMQHLLDQIMLRLLDYWGPYWDIEHGVDAQL